MTGPGVVGPFETSGEEVLDRIVRMRFSVWAATGAIDPDAFPEGRWRDPLDEVARHFAIEVDGALAAAARYARFDRLDDMPEASHYRKMGLDLEGPIGLPERLVVRREHAALGLGRILSDHLRAVAKQDGARFLVVEASAPIVAFLLARGRRHVGPAAVDPRFPGVAFQLFVIDLSRP